MNGINLLPWRLEKYQRALITFLIKLCVVFSTALTAYATLYWFHQQQQAELNARLQTLEQQKNRLAETAGQVMQIKQTIQSFTELQAIAPESVTQILSLLPQFPFRQGELESFNLNEALVQLKGFCLEQDEFERLHEFLSAHFISVKLIQFKPEQGRLTFEFELSSTIKSGDR